MRTLFVIRYTFALSAFIISMWCLSVMGLYAGFVATLMVCFAHWFVYLIVKFLINGSKK
jgi:hypothetical protein